ncbi:MAG: hypothetical protein Q9191_007112 [Dirinaria sp. TL-2023a]
MELGVASSVAGLLSLGIEVCGGLLQYYRSWKSAEEDVARTYVSVDALAKTLLLIKEVVEKNDFSTEHAKNVEASVIAVQQAINSLKKKLDKIKLTPKRDTWSEKPKAHLRRTLYPFKESTLVKLRELTQDARDDLDLAINTLQMCKITNSRPTLEEYLNVLNTLCERGFSSVYIVIDALDECTEENNVRRILLRECQRPQHGIRLLVTSRHIPIISQQLSNAARVEVQAKDEDIMGYIEERVSTSERLNVLVPKDAELRESLKRSVTEKASGMFLLARLHLDLLATKTTLRKLKSALSSLPEVLDDSYDEVMKRIEAQNIDEHQLARKVLYWILCAAMPLDLRMLQHALAVEPFEDSSLDHDGIPPGELIISVCAGMVVMQPDSGIVELVHYTAQEYLDRKASEYFPGAHEKLLHVCITYLSFDEFRKKPCEYYVRQRIHDYPLLRYASLYWALHVINARCEEKSQRLILDFINQQQTVSNLMQVVFWAQQPNVGELPRKSPLHVASYFGLRNTVRTLLASGADPATTDNWNTTALHNTADEEIASMLLENGAESNHQDDYERTPLMHSAWRGDEAVIGVLLKSGADITMRSVNGDTALHDAVRNAHEGASRLLLEAGADPDTKNSLDGHTSLHYAAKHGDQMIVDLLLSHRADPTLQNFFGKSPIHMAALRGYADCTQLMLDAVSKSSSPQRVEALVEEEGIIVKALVGYAQLNDVDAQGRSALMLACEGTLKHVVWLLEHGADPTILDAQGRTCLHHAAAAGYSKTVTRFLYEGLDPSLADKDGWTSLHWAAKGGKAPNVQILLEAGADPTLETKDGWTPSKIAQYHGRASVIPALERAGASKLSPESYKLKGRVNLSEWLVSKAPINLGSTRSFIDGEERPAICDGCEFVS